MPGLLGHIGTRGREETARRFGAARDRMRRHANLAFESVEASDGCWLLGRVRLNTAPTYGVDRSPHPARAMFHGVLHNEAALRKESISAVPADSINAVVAELYRRHDVDFVSRLDGEFCLALVDPQKRRALLATDTIGSYPLYWHAGADGLAFSSDLSAVLRATSAPRRPNLLAVADYLTAGVVLGDKTLAEGVQLADPGTVLVYGMDDGRVTLHKYVRLEGFFAPRWTDRREYLEAVETEFKQAIGRAFAGTTPIGLSLSGGLDSRTILGAINGRRLATLRTYTLGVRGCADQVIAAQLARIAGTQHRYFELDHSYLRSFLPNLAEMVSLTDGMYLSHGLTELLAVRFLGQTDINVLVRGHGGELAKAHLAWPLHTDHHVYELTTVQEFIPYISVRNNLVYMTGDLPLSRILRPEAYARAGEGVRESFASVLSGVTLSPAQCCSYLYLRELTRRFTIPSLELFRTQVDVRLPFLDASFLKVLLAAPPEWRDNTEIHRRLIRAGNPKLMKVRNANTGAAADAGPLAEFVLDKWSTVLKRLNVHGYRHYHNFDDWMRKGLLDSVEAELLSPSARVRSFVDTRTVQDQVQQTRAGVPYRSYLLQVLLILELWLRENDVGAAA